MNDRQKEQLLVWLNDAYALENAIVDTLDKQIGTTQNPEVKQKLQDHLDESKNQAERVKDRIVALGGDVSELKSTPAQVIGNIAGILGKTMQDSEVKMVVLDITIEHFEVAAYRAIEFAADEVGDIETADMCRDIVEEERDMADWLEDELSEVSETYISTLSS